MTSIMMDQQAKFPAQGVATEFAGEICEKETITGNFLQGMNPN